MPPRKTNKKSLRALVQKMITRSALLSPEVKERYLKVLPRMADEDCAGLFKVLKQENAIVKDLLKDTLSTALAEGNTEVPKQLNQTLKKITRDLRAEKEKVETHSEEKTLTHLEEELKNL